MHSALCCVSHSFPLCLSLHEILLCITFHFESCSRHDASASHNILFCVHPICIIYRFALISLCITFRSTHSAFSPCNKLHFALHSALHIHYSLCLYFAFYCISFHSTLHRTVYRILLSFAFHFSFFIESDRNTLCIAFRIAVNSITRAIVVDSHCCAR
jgi:hypothetical protein